MRVTAQSSTSLLVAWKPPVADRTVTGYYVGYKLLSAGASGTASSLSKWAGGGGGGISESFAYKTVEASIVSTGDRGSSGGPGGKGEESCGLTGLRKHARYQVMVQAFNSKGAGPPSDTAEAETLEFGTQRSFFPFFSLPLSTTRPSSALELLIAARPSFLIHDRRRGANGLETKPCLSLSPDDSSCLCVSHLKTDKRGDEERAVRHGSHDCGEIIVLTILPSIRLFPPSHTSMSPE